MSIHAIAAMRYGTSALDGLQSANFNPGISEFISGGDSNVYNTFGAVNQVAPRGDFNSFHLKKFLDLTGTTGLGISATPLDMWLQERKHGGIFETTGEKVSITKGMLIPVSLSASASGEASLAGEIIAGGSAGAVPYTVTSGGTVPTSPAAALSNLFKLGPCEINSVNIGEVDSVTVNFGINVQVSFGDGSVYPTLVYVNEIAPTISISTKDATQLSTLTVNGKADDVTVQFTKLTDGAAEASAGHLIVTAAEARIKVDSLGGSHRDDNSTSIMVTPLYDGENTPLELSYST